MKKVINILLGLAIVGAGLGSFRNLTDYAGYSFLTMAFAGITNFFFLRRSAKNKADYLPLFLPLVFLIGLFGTIAAVSSLAVRLFLGVASAFLFYFFSEGVKVLEEIITLAAVMLSLSFVWAVNFFFIPPGYVLLLLTNVLMSALFWQAFYKMGIRGPNHHLFAAISSLILIEVSWVTWFWPVHFLTAAVVPFSVFYLIYILSEQYFAGRLTRKKVFFQGGMIVVILALSVLSSSWQP